MESITKTVASPSVSGVTLESKVAFLRQPASFQERTYRVEAIETHMSWVFLTDRHAYKLKKPVCYDFLDFSTIDARHYYCQEEVRLNRRLAAGVYLGIVKLTLSSLGHLELDGAGAVTDWLIRMQRLPMRHMLDYAIRNGKASVEDVRRVAARLASFYRTCAPIAIDSAQYRRRFAGQIESILKELTSDAYKLPVKQVNRICSAQSAVLHQMADLFAERIEAGRILEGHGDLRPEHICLKPDLAMIDCLEFSRDLRIVDTADDLAFLALECERLGAGDLADLLLCTYSEIAGDWPSIALVHFYKSCRASLRATISIRHLNEETFRYSAEWRRRTEEYLRLAEWHASRCR
jgi:aminoglycoside phosphotransferase family enzyme